MRIDLSNYYNIGTIEHWVTSNKISMYTIELISKSTGEVITWDFTEEYFDKLLDEMEQEYEGLKAHYEYISWAIKEKEHNNGESWR